MSQTVTKCHKNVTDPPCRARQAAHSRHATPGAERLPPAARASQNVTEPSQNVTKCHRAAVPRAPGGACSPRPARRGAPAARHPRVTKCHKTVTTCHKLSQSHRAARHARRAAPAARASCRVRQTAHLGTMANGKPVLPNHYAHVIMFSFSYLPLGA